MEYIKKFSRNELLLSILLIIVGLILIIFPIKSLNVMSVLIAIITGIGCLANIVFFFIDNNVKRKIDTIYFVLSLFGLGLAIYTFLKPLWLITTLNIIVGLILLISAGNNFRYLIQYSAKNTLWWIVLGINILVVILGIVSLINPVRIASTIVRLEGISLVIDGIIQLLINRKFYPTIK